MAKIEWETSFTVGNDTIDRQHRKLVELYNSFVKIMADSGQNEARSAKIEALQLIHEYAIYHFRYEEHLMANHDYPGLLHHWRLNKDFDYKIFGYLRLLETGRLISSEEVLGMVRKCLKDHILQENMGLRRSPDVRPEPETPL